MSEVRKNVQNNLRNVKSSEFFWDNMSMLGFKNESRALVMAVKEAIDNAIDSCEDIGVMPDIYLELEDVKEDVIKMVVEDNAGGIPPEEIENVFGRILYSSKFGSWKQSRGQQGIGISAVFLWSQKYNGNKTRITSKQPEDNKATAIEITAEQKGKNIKKHQEKEIEWDKEHGTKLEIPIYANWRSQRHLEEYLKGTSLSNPSAKITYVKNGDKKIFDRTSNKPQEPPEEIKPHPNSVDIGMLEELIKQTNTTKVKSFLQNEFCSMDKKGVQRVLKRSDIDPENPFILKKDDLERLSNEMRNLKARAPPKHSLSPLGEDLVELTLQSYNPEFIGTSTRNLITIGGHPTIVETGIAYGGDIPSGDEVEYYRVANRVPLVYDSSGCALKKSVTSVDWSRYELDESASGHPIGPAIMFVHVCSTEVPFGSEAKTFVADQQEIVDEIKLSLEECGREFSSFVKEKKKRAKQKKKVEKMIPIYKALNNKLDDVTSIESDKMIHSIGDSCNTVIIDDRKETDNVVINPTPQNRNVTIDGQKVKISPGESVEFDNEVDYHYHPVYTTEVY